MLIRSFVKDDIISDITLHDKLNYVEVKVKGIYQCFYSLK